MIAVLVPAHDEEQLIAACLQSVLVAAGAPGLYGEEVRVVVALDRCTDGTGGIVDALGVDSVVVDRGNVGAARGAAAEHAIALGARWLATTDADSLVPPDWLVAQLAHGGDAFCGIVTVADWRGYPPTMAIAFAGTTVAGDGHPHVHGANLGISVEAYRRCGGFAALALSEDVALIEAAMAVELCIARKAHPSVVTSARRDARASGGFSDYLRAMEQVLAGNGGIPVAGN